MTFHVFTGARLQYTADGGEGVKLGARLWKRRLSKASSKLQKKKKKGSITVLNTLGLHQLTGLGGAHWLPFILRGHTSEPVFHQACSVPFGGH